MNPPLIIDIYQGDPVTDLSLTVSSGIIGCIHKATEGVGLIDPRYAARRKMWQDAGGELWGAYCFFHGRDRGGDPVREADHFLSAAEPDERTLLCIDWEDDEDGYKPPASEAQAFIERVLEKTGRSRMWIYGGNVPKERLHGGEIFFGKQLLWLCQYASHWTTPPDWTTPDLWQNNGDQYGPGPHHIPGISGYCDNSTIVTGTVGDLRAKWAGGGVPAALSAGVAVPDRDPIYPPPAEEDPPVAVNRKIAFHAAGTMSTFGGPHDTGVQPDEGLALYGNDAQKAADTLGGDWVLTAEQAGAHGLARRINPDKFYLAARWPTNRYDFLRGATVWVENADGKKVAARAVDWGPNVNTGRACDLSPGLAKELGLDTDDHCAVTVYEDGK